MFAVRQACREFIHISDAKTSGVNVQNCAEVTEVQLYWGNLPPATVYVGQSPLPTRLYIETHLCKYCNLVLTIRVKFPLTSAIFLVAQSFGKLYGRLRVFVGLSLAIIGVVGVGRLIASWCWSATKPSAAHLVAALVISIWFCCDESCSCSGCCRSRSTRTEKQIITAVLTQPQKDAKSGSLTTKLVIVSSGHKPGGGGQLGRSPREALSVGRHFWS